MSTKRHLTALLAAFALSSGFLTSTASVFAASKEKVLYSFRNKNGFDGTHPQGPLTPGPSGDLYGTTPEGGDGGCYGGCGTVFRLRRGANGQWTEKILYSFALAGNGAIFPNSSLVVDAAGNLYGTTYGGGDSNLGTVFQLTPGTNDKWSEKVLYSFQWGGGVGAEAGLTFDAAGNLYGTTAGGGSGCGGDRGCGTVFQLSPGANGKWTEKVLHNFGSGKDGTNPQGSLIFDRQGKLYGTTGGGGTRDLGVVFEMTP